MLSHEQRWALAIDGIKYQIDYLQKGANRMRKDYGDDPASEHVARAHETAIFELQLALNRMISLSENENDETRATTETIEA